MASPKIRHDWYQNDDHVMVSLFAKNASPESLNVKFEPRSMSVALKLSDSSDYVLELDLYADIVPESSHFSISTSKIELKLKKFVPGLKWAQLNALKVEPKSRESHTGRPSYPTSSKNPKDWDSLAKLVDEESKHENQQGEAALNALFQSIYANASDDAKKAMNKSYVESGGTCLSTDWNQVKKEKVAIKPPEGVQAKKFTE